MITRRGFLTSILAVGAAPAIVRAESLMKLVCRPSGLLVPSVNLYVSDWGDLSRKVAWDMIYQCYPADTPFIIRITGTSTITELQHASDWCVPCVRS